MSVDLLDILRWLHVIGAAVLLGTGAGIAFFMYAASRSRDSKVIAPVATMVVRADFLFTAPAVLLQPLTGAWLAILKGWSWDSPWLITAASLYAFVGACWLPVVVIQIRMRDLAKGACDRNEGLPATYRRLERTWILLGFPAFAGVLAILWLMLARPDL